MPGSINYLVMGALLTRNRYVGVSWHWSRPSGRVDYYDTYHLISCTWLTWINTWTSLEMPSRQRRGAALSTMRRMS
ncbi:MAG TPA: hypothetical protein VKB34_21050 [Povalibacter sp.]|nr:hypothetical protein [Povalibacter sp.]